MVDMQHRLFSPILQALAAVKDGEAPVAHARIAIRCLCGLLACLPHFNYVSDLLQAVVPNMANPDEQIR